MSGSPAETTGAPLGSAPTSIPAPPRRELRAPSRLLVLAGITVVGGLLAAAPLVMTAVGGVELVALLRNRWDPTWNDGDLAISAGGAAALLVILGGVAAAGAAVGRVGPFATRGTVVAAILGTLLMAAAAFGVLTALRG